MKQNVAYIRINDVLSNRVIAKENENAASITRNSCLGRRCCIIDVPYNNTPCRRQSGGLGVGPQPLFSPYADGWLEPFISGGKSCRGLI